MEYRVLGKYLNYYNGSADKLIVPEGVEEINWNNRSTWYKGDKTKVKIIIFPSTMKKVLAETLQGFTNLIAVYIPDGCTDLGRFGVQRMYILEICPPFGKLYGNSEELLCKHACAYADVYSRRHKKHSRPCV